MRIKELLSEKPAEANLEAPPQLQNKISQTSDISTYMKELNEMEQNSVKHIEIRKRKNSFNIASAGNLFSQPVIQSASFVEFSTI